MLKINIFKLYFAYCILLFQTCHAGSDYTIAFVHIGGSFPDYLVDALEQARLFNEDCDIIIIGNQIAFENNPYAKRFSQNKITEITCESFPETEAHRGFNRSTRLDKQFRDGFWNKATERFFYLDKLMHAYHLENVFHLENDNLLYVDLGELLPVFLKHYPCLANVFESDARSIPSFMFIRNEQAIQPFVNFAASKAHTGINDMHMIALYRTEIGNQCTNYLPVMPKEYLLDHNPLQNNIGQRAQEPTLFHQFIDEFNSVFDGAAYGQYLGGIDPRNGKSEPGFINESAFNNPSHFEFEWILDKQNRKVPHIKYRNTCYRINNLHLHCKNLKKFKSVNSDSCSE